MEWSVDLVWHGKPLRVFHLLALILSVASAQYQWTWTGGQSSSNVQSILAPASYQPGARGGGCAFVDDQSSQVYYFSGKGYGVSPSLGSFGARYTMGSLHKPRKHSGPPLENFLILRPRPSFCVLLRVSLQKQDESVRDTFFSTFLSAVFRHSLFQLRLTGARDARAGVLDDVWRSTFNGSEFFYQSGPGVTDNAGVYPAKGTAGAEASFFPSGRRESTSWYISASREMWVFGGVDSSGGAWTIEPASKLA